jgi:outer membrane protein OmpA-like peptidoglycan-associated protein
MTGSGNAATPAPESKSDNVKLGRAETVKEVTANLIKELEGLVEEARKSSHVEPSDPASEIAATEPKSQPEASTNASRPESSAMLPAQQPAPEPSIAAPASPALETPHAAAPQPSPAARPAGEPEMKQADVPPESKSDSPPHEIKSVPIPIMFVFREATFTEEGRKAATLLLEYVTLKKYQHIVLTGHADERGSLELNYDLSRDRLEAVVSLLKEGGYRGGVKLIPKGETEPFLGVDRSKYSREELFQLDRRVELIATH